MMVIAPVRTPMLTVPCRQPMARAPVRTPMLIRVTTGLGTMAVTAPSDEIAAASRAITATAAMVLPYRRELRFEFGRYRPAT